MHVPLALQHTVAGLPFANILASTPAFQDRKYFFSFSSDHITEIRDNFVHKVLAHNFSRPIFLRYSGKISKTFGKVHGVVNDGKFEAEDFHLLMQNSMFALAPEGDVPETFRFYEILENGAIPVIMTSTFLSYYRHFLPCSISRNILMSHDPGHALHQVQAHIKDSENMARFEERRRELISAFNDWRDDYQVGFSLIFCVRKSLSLTCIIGRYEASHRASICREPLWATATIRTDVQQMGVGIVLQHA